jgi:hypothetical protein
MRIAKMLIAPVLMLAVASTAAFAAEAIRGFPKADTRDKFKQLVVLVQQEMGAEGRYRFVSPTDRIKVDNKFGDMRAIFDKTDSVSAMDLDQKTALYNAQETINSLLTKNDSNRIVCRNKKIIGSNIPRRTCTTYGELKEEEIASQTYMAERARVVCSQPRRSPQAVPKAQAGIPCG